jgi:hypothetical protein
MPGADCAARRQASASSTPVLRAFDATHEHRPEFEVDWLHEDRLHFAPGTILEFRVVRDGTPGPPTRVVVGAESPQVVALR